MVCTRPNCACPPDRCRDRIPARLLTIALVILALGAAGILLGGCAVGQTKEGGVVLGAKVGADGSIEVPEDLDDHIGAGVGAIGGPAAGATAATITGAVLGILGLRKGRKDGEQLGVERGRHIGWDEHAQQAPKQDPAALIAAMLASKGQ